MLDGAAGSRALPKPLSRDQIWPLQLLEKFAGRAGDVDSAGDTAFAVFDALDDARGLAAFRAVGALGGVHDFLAVSGFCDFGAYGHVGCLLIFAIVVSKFAQRDPHLSSADAVDGMYCAGNPLGKILKLRLVLFRRC